MDNIDPTLFVSVFCTQLARRSHMLRQMAAWYLFEDHREGTICELFNQDAADFAAYQKLFVV